MLALHMLADHLWKHMGLLLSPNCCYATSYQHFFQCTPIIIILFRFCQRRWAEDCPLPERALEVWLSVLKVIKYWERLCKSSRPSIKSYQVVVDHYTEKLIPCKLQFFSFIAGIFEPYL